MGLPAAFTVYSYIITSSHHAYLHVQLFPSGLVYYVLGNLHPKLRSSLKSIQLLCAVKHAFIVKYGIERILQPIVEAIQELEKVNHAHECNYIY